jgi:putative membrane protein
MKHITLLSIYFIVLIWSAINPHDYFTWILEVFPALIGLGILLATKNKFPLTDITYILILVHCCILFVGGHYTYAEVPLFDWIKEYFGQDRNNYDKVGHIAQGFVPAIIIREVFVRKQIVKKGTWLSVIVVFFCLGISAMYELLEWLVAELSGEGADAFLGTQGYAWDTQSDMLCAMIGAISSLLLFSILQDKQINKLNLHHEKNHAI